jgi:hypothetical protein
MKISTTHQRFADLLNDQTALEYPERFLGPNWKDVLNFWLYLDTLSDEKLVLIEGYAVLWDLKCISMRSAVSTIGNEYASVAWDVPFTIGSSYATLELIGSHNLEAFTFLPLFLNP